MAASILGIGQSALAAAQAGLNTTGHNIANASTPGYNRQVIVQGAAQPQNFGYGFMGQGTDVSTVKRIYSEFLGSQVRTAQTAKSELDSYYTQIKQLDNMLADPSSGVSPALQSFFAGVLELSSNPSSVPARQATLSSAESLAARFQSMAGRLDEIEQGVNSQITASVGIINSYAQQIGKLNEVISRLQGSSGQPPNDLLDQRDQLILDLNKEIKASVVKQSDGSYNVFIGNGQPLVVGASISTLTIAASPVNPERLEVAFQTAGNRVIIAESSLAGGKLGGVVEFRSKTLEPAQNALGRMAIGLASTFNAQHQAGFDLNGVSGGAFFSVPAPIVNANSLNAGTANVIANISNVNALTTSDYRLQYDGINYAVTRLSDNTTTTYATLPQTVDGVDITLSGTPVTGDSFLIRPTVNGASGFNSLITDTARIAAAAQPGAVGDNRNALLLAGLQTTNTLGNGTVSYQGAYSQLVSQIGNKTRELEVTSRATGNMLSEATFALQSESGVNLDDEATNLLRYQQAYQAAGKVMQIAGQMFDVLLSLGN